MLNLNLNVSMARLSRPKPTKQLEFLVVAAGGRGAAASTLVGRSGGGGAGGVNTGTILLQANQPYTFNIGIGTINNVGITSSLQTPNTLFIASGGLAGLAESNGPFIPSQGGASGAPTSFIGGTSSGGGGGATSVGTNVAFPIQVNSPGGNGGAGFMWIDGIVYAGGGYGLNTDLGNSVAYPGQLGAPSGSFGNGGGAFKVANPAILAELPPSNGIGAVRYSGTPSGTGGQIVYNNTTDTTIHYFTSSGTFVPLEKGINPPPLPFGEFNIQLQIVGGGGAGSADIGGGGGAGGVRYVPSYLINDQKTYTVNVANSSSGLFAYSAIAGGTNWNTDPPNSNRSGSNSWFRDNVTLQDITGYGGGMGGGGGINSSGNQGGSGGGGSQFNGGGAASSGLLNTGSSGGSAGPSNYTGGGGGGGATQAGITGNSQFTENASNGGAGISVIGFNSGSSFVAGGGGGARNIGLGGLGGGGNNGMWNGDISSSLRPQNGTPNTGGGGGGLAGLVPNQFTSSFDTGGGGSGIVIIYYKGTQQAFGGQVETRELNDGFYTQHIYTASGQFIPTSNL